MNNASLQIKKVAIVVGLLLGAFAVSALADWTAPQSAPPACASGQPGCDAPINVGGSAQAKSGAIGLNETVSQILSGSTLDVNGTASANKLLAKYLQITGGAAAGNVLTSDASGNATWQAVGAVAPVSGTVGGGCFEYYYNYPINGPSGAISGSTWGNGSYVGGSSSCGCGGGYSSQQISIDSTEKLHTWLCLKN